MFDKLIDALFAWLDLLRFFYVVRCYEGGVILRWGEYHRHAVPGIWFMWPFNIEEVLTTNVAQETMSPGAQSLTTKDDISVIVRPVVTYKIVDPKVFLLEIMDADDSMFDATCGATDEVVKGCTWAELRHLNAIGKLTKLIRARLKPMGVHVVRVQLADCTRSRSVRLIQSGASHYNTVEHR